VNAIKSYKPCAEIYYVEDRKLIKLLNELIAEEAEISANTIDELLMLHNEMLEFFGSQVDTWMHTELAGIGNKKQNSLLSTIQGRKTLKQVLGLMNYGSFFNMSDRDKFYSSDKMEAFQVLSFNDVNSNPVWIGNSYHRDTSFYGSTQRYHRKI